MYWYHWGHDRGTSTGCTGTIMVSAWRGHDREDAHVNDGVRTSEHWYQYQDSVVVLVVHAWSRGAGTSTAVESVQCRTGTGTSMDVSPVLVLM